MERTHHPDSKNDVFNSAMATAAAKTPLTLARETMSGDLRDACLQWIRALQKPWADLSEEEQRAAIESLDKQCNMLVVQAVALIATTEKPTVQGRVDYFTAKGEAIRVTLVCPRTAQNLAALGDCVGGVHITSVDASAFTGQRAPVAPDTVLP
jgi:hypothetical protein